MSLVTGTARSPRDTTELAVRYEATVQVAAVNEWL
jgi:hypothetical protein